jgi:hypothetical protein
LLDIHGESRSCFYFFLVYFCRNPKKGGK